MYNITNKHDAIREIKKYLYVLAERVYPEMQRTTIDGFFDAETALAVKQFQELKGLNANGEVDYETFTAMYDDYASEVNDFYSNDYVITDRGFPIKVGALNEDVVILHTIINELAKIYTDIENVGTGSFYSPRSAKEIQKLRKIFRFHESDEVDKKLYHRMLAEISAERRKDKN